MTRKRGRTALLFGSGAILISVLQSCGIDLTEELAGRPCADEEPRCLEGYECRNEVCVALGSGGAGGGGAPGGGSSGAGNAGSGGASGAPTGGSSPAGGDGGTTLGGAGSGGGGASGGAVSGGTGGAPTDAGTGAADGGGGTPVVDAGPTRVGQTICGDQLTCDLATESCCVANATGTGTGYSCTSDTTGCAIAYGCDGDHDCPSGQVCCMSQGFTQNASQCADSCGSNAIRLECTKARDCDAGELCCGRIAGGFTIGNYDRLICQATCEAADERIMCDTAVECTVAPYTSCLPSTLLQGVKVCREP